MTPNIKDQSKKEQVRFRIDDGWYDVSSWINNHPGGAEILRNFHGEDATDVFYSIHSAEAIKKLGKMHKQPLSRDDKERTQLQKNFRALISKLEEDKWFQQNIWAEIGLVGIVFTLMISGIVLSHSFPLVAIFLIGLAMQQAGWIGHSYTHARHPGSWVMSHILSSLCNGFSPRWWAQKHCAHHALPNHTEVDTDIQLSPVFYLTAPDQKDDSSFRRFQHIYALPAYCLLYFSWKQQSAITAWNDRSAVLEVTLIIVHYVIMFSFVPVWVFLASIALAGFFVAVVVTASHQSEEFYHPDSKEPYDFVTAQFTTTRDAYNQTWLAKWFWGGMDTQLEHHLFPFMPQYYYHSLVPILKEFAKENNLEYRTEPAWDLLCRNMQTMKRIAHTVARKHDH